MKIGCCAWSLGWFKDSEDSIKIIGEEGFKGIELILREEKQLKDYYTEDRIRKIVEMNDSYDLSVSQFVIHSPLLEGLVNENGKKEALKTFERCTQIAKELGTDIINTVAHHLPGLSAPAEFLANYVYTYVPRMKKLAGKFRMQLPDSIDWDATWKNYADSIGACADIAGDAGLSFSLELHTYGLVANTDGFLKLYDDVGAKNLGINMDTGFHFAQREYIPMSIHKLKGKLLNIHARDGDGLICYHQAPGFGIIDWEDVIQALKKINYDGFLDLETDFYEEDTERTLRIAKENLEKLI